MKLFLSWSLLLRDYCNSLRLTAPFTIWQTLYPHRSGVFLFKSGFTQLSLFVIAVHVRIFYFIDKGNRKGRSSKRYERCRKVDRMVFKIMRCHVDHCTLLLPEHPLPCAFETSVMVDQTSLSSPHIIFLGHRERASAKCQYH